MSEKSKIVRQKKRIELPVISESEPIHPFSGSRVGEFSHVLINQVGNALWLKHSNEQEKDHQIQAILTAMMGIKPQDEIEGMLAAQMVATHNAAMECFRRSMMAEQTTQGIELTLNQANKLTRSYAALVESLNRYRGKGVSEQKVTVQHVNVSDGGQAIVGNIQKK
ncbi:MAG: hypothetical protein IPP67_06765 [Rhodospirillaceae bacterium]|nr:hypothetical protein [Rhodospirillaceae bacterium]